MRRTENTVLLPFGIRIKSRAADIIMLHLLKTTENKLTRIMIIIIIVVTYCHYYCYHNLRGTSNPYVGKKVWTALKQQGSGELSGCAKYLHFSSCTLIE